jgi:hypothetical protein
VLAAVHHAPEHHHVFYMNGPDSHVIFAAFLAHILPRSHMRTLKRVPR